VPLFVHPGLIQVRVFCRLFSLLFQDFIFRILSCSQNKFAVSPFVPLRFSCRFYPFARKTRLPIQRPATPTTAVAPPSSNASADKTEANATQTGTTEVETTESEIVVTATRNPQPLAQTTSAVTVITRRQIEDKKAFDLTDVIRLAPSVSIAQNGTRGKVSSIFLRGTNSNHTLVLIDGVRANSPADQRFDPGTIPVENIERIEVLRGPQSALYGSDAIGGVINIITRRGSGPFRTGGALEFGSDSMQRQTVSARGDLGRGGLSFSATRLRSGGEFQNDDYRNLGASLRIDRPLGKKSSLAFIGRVHDAEIGTPGQQLLSFDPNARSYPRDLFGSVQFTRDDRNRRDKISLGIYDRRLRFDDPINPGAAFGSFTNSLLKDRVVSLDAQSALSFGRHTVTFGGELRRETAEGDSKSTFGPTVFDRGTTTQALFAQDEFRSGKLALVPGVRLENNSQFGGDVNGRLAASYDISTHGRLKATIGTSFRAPAINELYFPQFGNPDLKPEKSLSYEVGYEQELKRDGRAELTLFRNRFRNLIGTVATPVSPAFPFGFKAGNANRATTQGVEIGFNQPFGRGFKAVVNQSFVSTSSTGGELLRRPRFNTSADLLFRRNKLNLDFGVVAQGRRFDNDFAAPPFGTGRGAGIYGGYTRFDVSAGYDVRPICSYIFAHKICSIGVMKKSPDFHRNASTSSSDCKATRFNALPGDWTQLPNC
jgi:vitamin B12 transporter